jgi:hypothetical protein
VCQDCNNAQHKDGASVQEGPARDAFVATVSRRMADGLQSRRQFIRGSKAGLGTCGNVAPTARLKVFLQLQRN